MSRKGYTLSRKDADESSRVFSLVVVYEVVGPRA